MNNYQPQRGDVLSVNNRKLVVHKVKKGEVYYHIVNSHLGRTPLAAFLEFVKREQPVITHTDEETPA